jgi:hypothetical protein
MRDIVIRGLEDKVLRTINNLNPRRAWRIAHLFGDELAIETTALLTEYALTDVSGAVQVFETLGFGSQSQSLGLDLVEWAIETVELKAIETRESKKTHAANKAANRAEYLHEPVFCFYKWGTDGEEKTRWKGDTDLRSAGLLSRIVVDLHGPQMVPCFAGIVNGQTLDEDGQRPPIDDDQWTQFVGNGLVVSGERLAINTQTPAWAMAVKALPLAIELAAYVHSLNAPVLPNAWFPRTSVQFRTLKANGLDMGTDGSGLLNVDAPEVQGLIAKHGVCTMQFRMLEPKSGLVAKGIVRPVRLGPDVPAFVLDWNQVKGAHKNLAMARRHEDVVKNVEGCYVGMLQAWNRPGKLSSCFEMLENIQMTPTTKAIVEEKVCDAMEKLVEGGTDALVAAVARDDETIRNILQFNTAMKAMGQGVEMTAIPRVREAVKEKLGRKLWHISQGAGIAFKRYVVVMDNSVTPGTIVAPDWKPGTKLATFRFPMVLAQGLTTVEVVRPKQHQLCGDETVQYTVFMNPADLTTRMQGDDDGDTIGLSSDPDMVELFKHLITDDVFHVEPIRQKWDILTNSEEGMKFVRKDQRGYVGRCTVYRSQLLAVGAVAEANAMSICIQENIDCAKGKIMWTDPRKVVNAWTIDENGEYHAEDCAFSEGDLDDGYFPLGLVKAWKNQILIERGCCYIGRNDELKAKNPLGWRYPGKRIQPDNWCLASQKNNWAGGNLVHFCNDGAFEAWKQIAEEFSLEGEELELAEVLPVLLKQKAGVVPLTLSWDDYNKGLRNRSGLRAYGKVFANIKGQNLTDDDKFRTIANANAELVMRLKDLSNNVKEHLSLLSTIWMMELSTGLESGINNAFRAVTWAGSPVMELLGIESEEACKFLDVTEPGKDKNREQRTVEMCLRAVDPFTKLAELIFHGKKHGDECEDSDGEPIHGWECPECRDRLETALVTRIRNDKKRKEHSFMKSTVSRLNGNTRE